MNAKLLWGLLAAVATQPLLAGEVARQPRPGVPAEYVSPGASGSIGSSSRTQSYEIYGGQALPESGYGQQSHSYGSSSVEQRGSIRQSTEYPGGYSVERYPGQSTQESQRQY
ncbi:hypothetical protein A9179_06670 [Pseudomonas alcaligenes]|uniref:Pro-resilin n=1 Tax=Aquipseudomonas alcaligenes TaxID=43263 RepID=A0ABR7RX93_AQUAC|nr:hypothetical protein [Pseudomonas alcaligenes]MBC9249957.1 hypothetical protein [Pseudomonas alcaligenes]